MTRFSKISPSISPEYSRPVKIECREVSRTMYQRSVVPYWFEEMSLVGHVKMYHDKPKEGEKRIKELFRGLIMAKFSVIGQINAGRPPRANRCRIEYTGSMFEGTTFGRPIEFDVMIVIDGSEDIESQEITPGYVRLRAKPPFPHRFSKCLNGDQNINPTKMLDWFYGLVQKAVNKVNIKERNGLSIDVDLVLCIQLDDQYYVAKPYKPYADEPPYWSLRCDPAMLWRQSFSVDETSTLKRIDGANECRRDCLRVLKELFRREAGLDKLTSFHLKTVLLHMCQEEDQWQRSKMNERFFDLLRRRLMRNRMFSMVSRRMPSNRFSSGR
uniref:Uncharacterized protein n=1 Tax=Branchiostoma floridae TaxID=7739 RepID=C3YLM0_BRAFL|eukprot:XP_002602777.1 hypothetical protein BRAFLDRAFT_93723 [Branchiostoma floridae]